MRRIASNLFWLTRYLERAEWRARLLDVNYRLLVESPTHSADGWWPLLAITGEWDLFSEHYSGYDERSILAFFTFDPDNRSSITTCLEYARENCRAARHRISSELWLEVNTLYLESKRWTFEVMRSQGLLPFFAGRQAVAQEDLLRTTAEPGIRGGKLVIAQRSEFLIVRNTSDN